MVVRIYRIVYRTRYTLLLYGICASPSHMKVLIFFLGSHRGKHIFFLRFLKAQHNNKNVEWLERMKERSYTDRKDITHKKVLNVDVWYVFWYVIFFSFLFHFFIHPTLKMHIYVYKYISSVPPQYDITHNLNHTHVSV